jgi:hypothetical protein
MVGVVGVSVDGGVGDDDGGNHRGEDPGVEVAEVAEVEGELDAMLEDGSGDMGTGVSLVGGVWLSPLSLLSLSLSLLSSSMGS